VGILEGNSKARRGIGYLRRMAAPDYQMGSSKHGAVPNSRDMDGYFLPRSLTEKSSLAL